jgi:hypothetical protein
VAKCQCGKQLQEWGEGQFQFQFPVIVLHVQPFVDRWVDAGSGVFVSFGFSICSCALDGVACVCTNRFGYG